MTTGACGVKLPGGPEIKSGDHRMSETATPFRALEGRARLAIIFFWIYIGATASFALSLIACISVGANIYSEVEYPAEDTAAGGAALLALFATAAVYAISLLICIIVFLMWLYRARHNLPALGVTDARWKPFWSIVWWFIPIMSLFKPYQLVRETWQASDPTTSPGWRRDTPPPLFGWWWALFLVYSIGGRFTDRYTKSVTDPNMEAAVVLTGIDLIGLLAGIAAAWAAIRIMSDITTRQRQRHQVGAFA